MFYFNHTETSFIYESYTLDVARHLIIAFALVKHTHKITIKLSKTILRLIKAPASPERNQFLICSENMFWFDTLFLLIMHDDIAALHRISEYKWQYTIEISVFAMCGPYQGGTLVSSSKSVRKRVDSLLCMNNSPGSFDIFLMRIRSGLA